jgi:hypothetical protein
VPWATRLDIHHHARLSVGLISAAVETATTPTPITIGSSKIAPTAPSAAPQNIRTASTTRLIQHEGLRFPITVPLAEGYQKCLAAQSRSIHASSTVLLAIFQLLAGRSLAATKASVNRALASKASGMFSMSITSHLAPASYAPDYPN